MQIRHVLGFLAAFSLSASAGLAATAAPADHAEKVEAQPHMRAARALLQTAKGQLQRASHDKGGHRAKAVAHVDAALSEVAQGIAHDDSHSASASDHAAPLEAQPHMKAALKTLHGARAQLEKASHDKGGHRAKALKEVKLAIDQVEKGIAFDQTH
ncbi:MAG: hypothetical protein HYZ29_21265 [Myxococcales bacterium]|nr:hypothetical protein [Myxococcales bacterium]